MTALTRRAALQAAAAAAAAGTLPAEQALAQAAAPPAATDRPLFGATLRTLPNGLRVAHVEQRRAPVVAHYAYVAAGGAEDPHGLSGIAHYLEHMLFKGSARVASGEFSRRVAREGGVDNAFTSRDVTGYFQHVEAGRLGLVAMMEADRFATARIPEAEMESERLVILEERAQRTGSSPRALFFESFDAAMWGPQHWRGRPIIGWEEEIRAIRHEDLLAFFRARYAPGNAVLVVAGAVGGEAFWRTIEAEWGALPAGPPVPRDRAPPPPAPPVPRLVRNDPRLRGEAVFIRSWQAPSMTAGETRFSEPPSRSRCCATCSAAAPAPASTAPWWKAASPSPPAAPMTATPRAGRISTSPPRRGARCRRPASRRRRWRWSSACSTRAGRPRRRWRAASGR